MSRSPKRHKGLDEEDLSPPVTITHTVLPGWQITRSVKEWQDLGFYMVNELLDGTLELSMYPEWVEVWKVFLTLGAIYEKVPGLSPAGQLVVLRYLGEPDFMKKLPARLRPLNQEQHVRVLFHLFGKSVPPKDCVPPTWWNWEQVWDHHQDAVEEPAFQHYLQWAEQNHNQILCKPHGTRRKVHTITRDLSGLFIDQEIDTLIQQTCVSDENTWCIVAGGAVAGVMTQTPFQDVDFFVGGTDFYQVRNRFLVVALLIAKTFPTAQLSCGTRGCILQFDIPDKPYALQVILTYKAGYPMTFIESFDLPPCQALVHVSGKKLKVEARLEALMTWSSRHIVWEGTNERTLQRLKKYCQRGYTCDLDLSVLPDPDPVPHITYTPLHDVDLTNSLRLFHYLEQKLTFIPVESDYETENLRIFGEIQLLTPDDKTGKARFSGDPSLLTELEGDQFKRLDEHHMEMDETPKTWLVPFDCHRPWVFIPCRARIWVFSSTDIIVEPVDL